MNSYLKLCSSVTKTKCQDHRIVIVQVRCLSSSQAKLGTKEVSKVKKRGEIKWDDLMFPLEIFQHIILTADNVSREGGGEEKIGERWGNI